MSVTPPPCRSSIQPRCEAVMACSQDDRSRHVEDLRPEGREQPLADGSLEVPQEQRVGNRGRPACGAGAGLGGATGEVTGLRPRRRRVTADLVGDRVAIGAGVAVLEGSRKVVRRDRFALWKRQNGHGSRSQ